MTSTQDRARPATSTDVAKVAGVSRATVSRILNGDEAPFPEATRQRVREAAAKLSYRPSGAARSLVTGQSDTIVIVAPDTRFGGHLQDSVDEVAAQTRRYGGNVVVRVASVEPRVTLDAVIGLRPFAVLNFGVLGPSAVAALAGRGIIVVPNAAASGAVRSDPGIARLQGRALVKHGERPIWYALPATERPEPFSDERLTALREFCEQGNLEPPRSLSVGLDVEGGRGAVGHMLAHAERAAVACYNDDVALTILAGARELGVRVPGSIALVGVDDTLAGRLWSPRLTTVHVDMHGFIATLVDELRAQLEGVTEVAVEPLPTLFTLVPGETA